jgi:Icc-related predicted phosphoesterase
MWFFVSDLHGSLDRYRALLAATRAERPEAVLIGGDLLPSAGIFRQPAPDTPVDFFGEFLAPELETLRDEMGDAYPRWVVILGNDDPGAAEATVLALADRGLLEYAHMRRVDVGGVPVYGYGCVPPTPFPHKDWEREDTTIQRDLEELVGNDDLGDAALLFHTPPYRTTLDRAAIDGLTRDGVPLDVHVGSAAVRRFIEERQPRLTLHGHIHESARMTGAWSDRIGGTVCLSAAHHGPELALVQFEPGSPADATRRIVEG